MVDDTPAMHSNARNSWMSRRAVLGGAAAAVATPALATAEFPQFATGEISQTNGGEISHHGGEIPHHGSEFPHRVPASLPTQPLPEMIARWHELKERGDALCETIDRLGSDSSRPPLEPLDLSGIRNGLYVRAAEREFGIYSLSHLDKFFDHLVSLAWCVGGERFVAQRRADHQQARAMLKAHLDEQEAWDRDNGLLAALSDEERVFEERSSLLDAIFAFPCRSYADVCAKVDLIEADGMEKHTEHPEGMVALLRSVNPEDR